MNNLNPQILKGILRRRNAEQATISIIDAPPEGINYACEAGECFVFLSKNRDIEKSFLVTNKYLILPFQRKICKFALCALKEFNFVKREMLRLTVNRIAVMSVKLKFLNDADIQIYFEDIQEFRAVMSLFTFIIGNNKVNT